MQLFNFINFIRIVDVSLLNLIDYSDFTDEGTYVIDDNGQLCINLNSKTKKILTRIYY